MKKIVLVPKMWPPSNISPYAQGHDQYDIMLDQTKIGELCHRKSKNTYNIVSFEKPFDHLCTESFRLLPISDGEFVQSLIEQEMSEIFTDMFKAFKSFETCLS